MTNKEWKGINIEDGKQIIKDNIFIFNSTKETRRSVVITSIIIGLIGVISLVYAVNLNWGNSSINGKKITFSCSKNTFGIPTTIVKTPRGEISMINWGSSFGGVAPQKRCEDVSKKFEEYYNKDILKYIKIGNVNNQLVVCVSKEIRGDCSELLFTLRPEEDPKKIIKSLINFSNDYVYQEPLYEESKSPEIYVNIEKILQTAPNNTANTL